MPHADTYRFYQAYVTNVKDFLLAATDINRTINRAYKTGKPLTARVQTKIYALLYSTFSEANFMKMILTPYGFEQAFVDEILRQGSVQEKWFKCIDLAFTKFSSASKGSEVPNKKQELKKIVQQYIIDPSVLRNKIAHGQLTIALNSKVTDLHEDLTGQLAAIDTVMVYRWFEINRKLSHIIEDLIESPDKAHHNYYYAKYQELEAFIDKTASWTVASKLETPNMKRPVRYQAKPAGVAGP